jgi:predicted PurR-regulated permease PerM
VGYEYGGPTSRSEDAQRTCTRVQPAAYGSAEQLPSESVSSPASATLQLANQAETGRGRFPAVKLSAHNSRHSAFITFATVVMVVTIMKIAEDIVIPIAMTVLLTFLLSPFVVRLTRVGLPKWAAIIITVTSALGIMVALGAVVITQGVALAKKLPDYEENIREKLAAIRAPHSPEGLSRMTQMIRNLQQDMQPTAPAPATPAPAAPQTRPVQVEVKQPQPSALVLLRSLVGPLLGPLGTAAIVIVFVVAMLFQREDLRDRFIRVISSGRLNLATQALDDAARRVTRYLSMQLVVNATYGIPVGVGLHLIGIPNALLWGVLATLLRFIPFLGPWVAAAFPIALAAAVDPGWSKLVYTLVLFVTMELISNNIVEPWLYGSSTGISNLALMIAAVFWTWLWGTPGLFLSTPLTVCLMVMGKHITGLRSVSVLLGSEPGLEPSARFYQRMLAMDLEEMRTMAFKHVDEHSLEAFYNDVFLPALLMSEQDRHSGALAEVRQKFIFESSRELIEDLERHCAAADKDSEMEVERPEDRWTGDRFGSPMVFIVPARDDADEVAGLMLEHLLRRKNIEADVLPAATRLDDSVHFINQHQVPITIVSALPPAALFGARQLCRRIKEQCPGTFLGVGIWSREANYSDLRVRLRRPRPNAIITHLGEAVRQIEGLLQNGGRPADVDFGQEDKKSDSRRSELMESQSDPILTHGAEPDEVLNSVMREVAQHFDVPLSLVSIVSTDAAFWKSHSRLTPEVSELQDPASSVPVSMEETQIVEDVSKDKRFDQYAPMSERGVKFYGSVPLRTRSGRIVGALVVVDTKPHPHNDCDAEFLESCAETLMTAAEPGEENTRTQST